MSDCKGSSLSDVADDDSDQKLTNGTAFSSVINADHSGDAATDDHIVALIRSGQTAEAITIMLYEFRNLLTVMRLPPHQQKRVLFESLGLLNLKKITEAPNVQLPEQLTIPNDSECHYLMSHEDDFLRATRLTVSEFIILFNEIGMHIIQSRSTETTDDESALEHARRHVHRELPPCDELLLWFYHSDGNDNNVIAQLFRISWRSVSRISDHITHVINRVWLAETAWPSPEERRALYGFFSIHEKAVALMDGTHCRVCVPRNNVEENATYSGYKKYHTQNYLICVNALGLVIYIDGPHAGRGTDRKIFNKSVFAHDDCPLLSDGELIIADGGFIGQGKHLIPLKAPTIAAQPENEQKALIEYNEEVTMNRSKVEHIIHVVKNRAQILAVRYKRERRKQADIFYAAARFANRIKRMRMEHQLAKISAANYR